MQITNKKNKWFFGKSAKNRNLSIEFSEEPDKLKIFKHARGVFALAMLMLFLASGFAPVFAEEGRVVISPYVIDEQAKASEQIERLIKIKNETEHKVDLYPMVNDISMETGRQEFISPGKLDKSTSLARWILIQRGVIQLMPGEEAEVPLKIDINGSAVPGKRYAAVSFPQGSNTTIAAENLEKNSVPQLLINLEIMDVSIEKAQLAGFKAEKNTFFKWPAKFLLSIKNIGTVEIVPRGSINFFNRREMYLEKIAINEAGEKIAPGETKELAIAWSHNKGMGKFKARLELEYGAKDKRDLADTAYFWILPFWFVVIFIGGLVLAVSILTFYLFRKTYISHRQIEEAEEDDPAVINLRNK